MIQFGKLSALPFHRLATAPSARSSLSSTRRPSSTELVQSFVRVIGQTNGQGRHFSVLRNQRARSGSAEPGYAARPREATHIVRDDHLRATSEGELHDVEAGQRAGVLGVARTQGPDYLNARQGTYSGICLPRARAHARGRKHDLGR